MSSHTRPSLAGPLYEQVHDMLRSRILAGEWNPRQALPGEASLSQEFGVSVGTVRKAMDQLTRDNIVTRERGRGTFVRHGKEWRGNSMFRLRNSTGDPINAAIIVVDSQVETPDPVVARQFRPRDPRWSQMRVHRLTREWWLSDLILCRETLVVEQNRFPELTKATNINSETLFNIYKDEYYSTVDSIRWQFDNNLLFNDLTNSWKNDLSAPQLKITRTALDSCGETIEICAQMFSLAYCAIEIVR